MPQIEIDLSEFDLDDLLEEVIDKNYQVWILLNLDDII